MRLAESAGSRGPLFARLWSRFEKGLSWIAALLLFVMMIVTFSDVALRYVFSKPIPGGFEIVQYLMAFVVMASLPVTTANESHITVSIFTSNLRGRVRIWHRVFVLVLTSIGMFVIAWRLANQAQILVSSQQVSGFLKIPLGWIAYPISVLAFLAVAVILLKLVAVIVGRDLAFGEPNQVEVE